MFNRLSGNALAVLRDGLHPRKIPRPVAQEDRAMYVADGHGAYTAPRAARLGFFRKVWGAGMSEEE